MKSLHQLDNNCYFDPRLLFYINNSDVWINLINIAHVGNTIDYLY